MSDQTNSPEFVPAEPYVEMTYPELKKLAAERGIKAVGDKNHLVDSLTALDLGLELPEAPRKKDAKQKGDPRYEGLKPSDPNPDNPNWDMAGRWIRRRKGWKPPK